MTTKQWQQRYLGALGLEARTPTLDYLRQLIRLQLRRFPFENVSKIHYYLNLGQCGMNWMPSPGAFLSGHHEFGFGGNCYILNRYFGELLASLGYEVALVQATGGNLHLALMVNVDGRKCYVDVGYGAPLFDPVQLEEEPRFTRFGEEVEIRRLADSRYMIDRRTNGQSFVTKTIIWEPVSLLSFEEPITDSLRDLDDNPFMRRITATVFREHAAYSVVNRRLFVKYEDRTEIHDYADKEEWLSMMGKTFGFDQAVIRQALHFLAERGVKLFGDESIS